MIFKDKQYRIIPCIMLLMMLLINMQLLGQSQIATLASNKISAKYKFQERHKADFIVKAKQIIKFINSKKNKTISYYGKSVHFYLKVNKFGRIEKIYSETFSRLNKRFIVLFQQYLNRISNWHITYIDEHDNKKKYIKSLYVFLFFGKADSITVYVR